jgi:DNA-binding MarR family transcriptional regulator
VGKLMKNLDFERIQKKCMLLFTHIPEMSFSPTVLGKILNTNQAAIMIALRELVNQGYIEEIVEGRTIIYKYRSPEITYSSGEDINEK